MYQLEVAKSLGWDNVLEEIAECAEAEIYKIEVSIARIEVDFDPEELEQRLRCVRDLCNKHQIQILSIHLPFGRGWEICNGQAGIRERAVEQYQEFIKCCRCIEPKRYILHPGCPGIPNKEREKRIYYLRKTLAVLSEAVKPAKLAVENMSRDCLGNTSEELIRIVEDIENVCVCCDMNHWMQEKNYEAIRKLGSRIETVHVSDYDEVEERHWLPGDGCVDWNKVLAALEETGYNGPFLYESYGQCGQVADSKKRLFDEYNQGR